jgi:cytochrome c-type biogenesis protein CcmH
VSILLVIGAIKLNLEALDHANRQLSSGTQRNGQTNVPLQTATAQAVNEPVTDDRVNAVAKELYCPVCQNTPLDVCPTTACIQWRELIRTKLAEGWSVDQVKEYFAAQYGPQVLAQPPRQGIFWLVYVLPPVFFLIGAGIVFWVLRSMRAKAPAGNPSARPAEIEANLDPDDEYVRKMEEELKKRGS